MNSLLPSICNHDQTTRRWKAKRERISNLDQGSGRKDRRASSSCRHHPLRSMKSNPYRFLLTSKTTGKQIRICIKLYSIEMRRRKKKHFTYPMIKPQPTENTTVSDIKRKSEEEVVSKKLEAFIAPVFFIYWWGKRNQETDHSFFLIGNRSCGRCTNKKRLCISSYIFFFLLSWGRSIECWSTGNTKINFLHIDENKKRTKSKQYTTNLTTPQRLKEKEKKTINWSRTKITQQKQRQNQRTKEQQQQ